LATQITLSGLIFISIHGKHLYFRWIFSSAGALFRIFTYSNYTVAIIFAQNIYWYLLANRLWVWWSLAGGKRQKKRLEAASITNTPDGLSSQR